MTQSLLVFVLLFAAALIVTAVGTSRVTAPSGMRFLALVLLKRTWRLATLGTVALVILGISSIGTARADPSGPIAFVTSGHFSPNPADSKLTAFDPYTGDVLYTVPFPVGSGPGCVAVLPSGLKAYVCEYHLGGTGSIPGDIAVVDLVSHTIADTIPIGPVPARAATSPDGSRLYVADWGSYTGGPVSGSGGITIIRTSDNAVIGKVMMGLANGVVVSPDGSTIYAAKSTSNELWVIDAAQADSCPNTGYFDPSIDLPCPAVLHRISTLVGVSNPEPGDLEVSQDGTRLYVGNHTAPIGPREYDISIPQNPTWIRSYSGAATGFLTLDATGRWLHTSEGTGVRIFDTSSASTLPHHSFPVGSQPTCDPVYSVADMDITDDGKALVVANASQGTVTFIDRTNLPETIVNVVSVGADCYWSGSFPGVVVMFEASSSPAGPTPTGSPTPAPPPVTPTPTPIPLGGIAGLLAADRGDSAVRDSTGDGGNGYVAGLAAVAGAVLIAGGWYTFRRFL